MTFSFRALHGRSLIYIPSPIFRGITPWYIYLYKRGSKKSKNEWKFFAQKSPENSYAKLQQASSIVKWSLFPLLQFLYGSMKKAIP